MCLNSIVTEDKKVLKEFEGKVYYKVFNVYSDGSLDFPVCDREMIVNRGVWLRAEKKIIGLFPSYVSGFHVFIRLEDAKFFASDDINHIFRVEVGGVRIRGIQKWLKKDLDVLVCDRIRILDEVKVRRNG